MVILLRYRPGRAAATDSSARSPAVAPVANARTSVRRLPMTRPTTAKGEVLCVTRGPSAVVSFPTGTCPSRVRWRRGGVTDRRRSLHTVLIHDMPKRRRAVSTTRRHAGCLTSTRLMKTRPGTAALPSGSAARAHFFFGPSSPRGAAPAAAGRTRVGSDRMSGVARSVEGRRRAAVTIFVGVAELGRRAVGLQLARRRRLRADAPVELVPFELVQDALDRLLLLGLAGPAEPLRQRICLCCEEQQQGCARWWPSSRHWSCSSDIDSEAVNP